MQRILQTLGVVGTVGILVSSGGTAFADTQPADLGNVANIERGASEPGPHCHFVVPAQGHHFDMIITGAAHQGHMSAGFSDGPFVATTCP